MEMTKTYFCIIDNESLVSYNDRTQVLIIGDEMLSKEQAQALFEFLRELANEGALGL